MGRTLGNSFLCFSKTAQFICGTTSMLCEKEIFFLFAEFGMTCLHSLPIIYQSRGFPHSPPRLSIFAPRKYSECSSMSALRKKKGKKEREEETKTTEKRLAARILNLHHHVLHHWPSVVLRAGAKNAPPAA